MQVVREVDTGLLEFDQDALRFVKIQEDIRAPVVLDSVPVFIGLADRTEKLVALVVRDLVQRLFGAAVKMDEFLVEDLRRFCSARARLFSIWNGRIGQVGQMRRRSKAKLPNWANNLLP